MRLFSFKNRYIWVMPLCSLVTVFLCIYFSYGFSNSEAALSKLSYFLIFDFLLEFFMEFCEKYPLRNRTEIIIFIVSECLFDISLIFSTIPYFYILLFVSLMTIAAFVRLDISIISLSFGSLFLALFYLPKSGIVPVALLLFVLCILVSSMNNRLMLIYSEIITVLSSLILIISGEKFTLSSLFSVENLIFIMASVLCLGIIGYCRLFFIKNDKFPFFDSSVSNDFGEPSVISGKISTASDEKLLSVNEQEGLEENKTDKTDKNDKSDNTDKSNISDKSLNTVKHESTKGKSGKKSSKNKYSQGKNDRNINNEKIDKTDNTVKTASEADDSINEAYSESLNLIKEYEKKNNELNELNLILQESYDTLSENKDELESRYKLLEERNHILEEREAALTEENTSLSEAIESMAAASAVSDDNDDEKSSGSNETSDLILELKDENSRLSSEYEGLVEENARLTSAYDGLVEDNAKLSSAYDGVVEENAKLTSAYDGLVEENTKLTSAYDGLVEENTKLTSAYDGLVEENTKLTSAYDGLVEENTKLTSSYDGLVEENTKLTSSYDGLVEENTKLTSEYDGLVEENAKLTSEYEEIMQENTRLTSEYDGVVQENTRLSSAYDEIMQENTRLTSEYDGIVDDNPRLKASLEELQLNYDILHEDYNDVQDNYIKIRESQNELQEQIDRMNSDYQTLQNMYSEVKNENADMKELLKVSDEDTERVKEKYQLLCREHAALLEQMNSEPADESDEDLSCYNYSLEFLTAENAPYVAYMSEMSSEISKHCMNVMKLALCAGKHINYDTELIKAISIYLKSEKILGVNSEYMLLEMYKLPTYIYRQIQRINNKENTMPVSREAGLVMLADDIVNTLEYCNRKKVTVPWENLVLNTIKVRRDQNQFVLSGISADETVAIKHYFTKTKGAF